MTGRQAVVHMVGLPTICAVLPGVPVDAGPGRRCGERPARRPAARAAATPRPAAVPITPAVRPRRGRRTRAAARPGTGRHRPPGWGAGLAIDQLRSARARRERYVGEWLPEPLVTDPSPAEHAETADSLSLAFLVLLESLSPHQRAAFLLREVFEYPYAEVAEIVGTDVDSARHLVARARTHVQARRPRYYASRRQRQELAQRFFAAAQQGDLRALEALLAHDVALHADGGGKVPALARPINGRERVARTLSAGMAALARYGVRIQVTEVNGQPGAMAIDAQDRLVGVMGLDIADGQIQTIHSIANPDKLRHLDRDGDLAALLRARSPSGDDG